MAEDHGIEREGRVGVVHLEQRLTRSWSDYHAKLRDADSQVYVGDSVTPQLDSPITLSLSVGTQWLNADDERFYAIPGDGIQLKSKQTVIVETNETIATPYNVFGVVTGKGAYIFRGLLISPGKIDPGFHGKLRIGIYNGSRDKKVLTTGTPIALAYFLGTDTTLQEPIVTLERFEATRAVASPRTAQVLRWLKANWLAMIPIVISVASLFVAIYRTRH